MTVQDTEIGIAPADRPPVGLGRARWNSDRWIGAVAVVIFVGVWQFVTSAGIVERIFLASPLAIVEVAYEQFFVTGDIYPNILVSLKEAVLGFGLAIVFGVLLGLAMGRFDRVRRVLEPFVMALYSTPSVALLPLFVLWFGIEKTTVISYAALSAFFPMIVNVAAAGSEVKPNQVLLARAMGYSHLQIYRKVVFPAMLLIQIMRPRLRAIMPGKTAWRHTNPPRRLTFMMRSQSSSLIDSGGPSRCTPAAWTSASRPPR